MSNPHIFEHVDPEKLLPLHREMFDYWLAKKPGSGLPARADFDPVDFPNIIPWVLMLDVVPTSSAPRYRFRLFGTGLVKRAGKDLTGLYLEDAFPESQQQAYFFDAVDLVIRDAEPVGYLGHSMILGREYIQVVGLLLPLASNGRDVDIILGVNLKRDLRRPD